MKDIANYHLCFFFVVFSLEEKPIEDFVMPEKPEIVMFASYSNTPKYPVKVSVLGEMVSCTFYTLFYKTQ